MSQLISQIVLVVFQLVVAVVLGYAFKLVPKALMFFESKTTAFQRQLLGVIAQDAVVFVEKQWQDVSGPGKFGQAVQHAIQVANGYGLQLNTQDIQAAIEAAYQQAKQQNLVGGKTVVNGVSGDAVVQAISGAVEQ